MKYIIILGDGMADYPIPSLGGKTTLMAANTPNMDELARIGRSGMLKTVPDDMPPGSEVANLAVLGYDVRAVYQGRGVLEGAAMGVQLSDTDLAMRCNLLCIEDGKIKNHSAGHISTEEGRELIAALNQEFANEQIHFYPGVSYRHLLVIKDGSSMIKLTPPHDVPGTPYQDVMPEATDPAGSQTTAILTDLIIKSQAFLAKHPINIKRRELGKDMGNSVWFWSAGKKPKMKTYMELYGKTGAVISAVDLLHGIGVYAGFKVIHVEGATGLYNTNYEGKVAATLNALKEVDMVYLHIEAADEAGHEGNVELKVKCIEAIDSRVVKPIMGASFSSSEPFTIALLPDHPTPCTTRSHVHDPIPFVIYKPGQTPDEVLSYDELSATKGAYGYLENGQFIRALFAAD